IDASYLWWKYSQPEPLICPLGNDCSAVLDSKWATFLGVRNEILGTIFYAGILLLALGLYFLPAQTALLVLLLKIGATVGLLTSIFLVGVQVYMGNYCLYCLISAAVSTMIFVASFWL
ncbi:MAG: vitamin K epoxide reductase family protein, partial [Patescibacteria group bacterium]